MAMRQFRSVHGWPPELINSILLLLGEIRQRPTPSNAFYVLTASDALAEDVTECWDRLKAHLLWKRLSQDAELAALRQAFLKNRTRSKRTVLPRHEFELLYLALRGAQLYTLMPRNWKGWGPSSMSQAARATALSAIDRLNDSRKRGARLHNPLEDRSLSELLERLQDALVAVERKTHKHGKYPESESVRLFTQAVLNSFGDTSDTVLRRFAEFAGIDLEDKTIQGILRDERRRRLVSGNPSHLTAKRPQIGG